MDKIDKQISDYESQIAGLQNKINDLKKQKEEPEVYRLARLLHGQFCKLNHTDYCGWYCCWYYREHDWVDSTHQDYLRRAETVLCVVDYKTAIKFLKALESI